jgi:hypothetical protein
MKDGATEMLSTLHHTEMWVWQLHRSLDAGAINFADEQIANLNASTALQVTRNPMDHSP